MPPPQEDILLTAISDPNLFLHHIRLHAILKKEKKSVPRLN
ncbi:hypothetical protein SAMN02745161_0960 [Halodesulfovibrio marinisediminis DSM 17456]|uniref:Uncharacterized protein n=1 Tax=Halodesulfovibrio marinisediminis DSM 17456 TaxID=1121457 RepID=A0A1N6EWP4_9BACT|nr:hypothetical protein SAMN02745161_0960 [Halodesulfovibrio marinisediminis DSM 17456]